MPFETLLIPGVVGEVSTELSPWTGYRLYANGQRVRARGLFRSRLLLPGEGGRPVAATVRASWLRAYPVLRVGGLDYYTGPSAPRNHMRLALLPLLAFLSIPTGPLLAFVAVSLNMAAIRSPRRPATKVAVMTVVDIVVLALAVVMGVVYYSVST